MTVLSVGAPLNIGLGGIIRGIGSIAGTIAGAIPGVGPVVSGLLPSSSCPPGTACSGPSALGVCLGACRPIGGRGGGILPGETQCPAGFVLGDPLGTGRLQCVEQQAFGPPLPGGNGRVAAAGACVDSSICATPGGQKGRMKCVVEKGVRFNKCVATRRTNFGNVRAARKAATRLKGAIRTLRNIESITQKAVPAPRRARQTSRRGKAECRCG